MSLNTKIEPPMLDLDKVTKYDDAVGFQTDGDTANRLFEKLGVQGIKFTNEECVHHGVEYKEGLIEDPVAWSFEAQAAGGIYGTTTDRFVKWLNYTKRMVMLYVWTLQFPPEARVSFENNCKFKASAIILYNRRLISELTQWKDPEIVRQAIKHNQSNLVWIPKLDGYEQASCARLGYYRRRSPLLQVAPLHVQIQAIIEHPPCVMCLADSPQFEQLALFALYKAPKVIHSLHTAGLATPEMMRVAFRSDPNLLINARDLFEPVVRELDQPTLLRVFAPPHNNLVFADGDVFDLVVNWNLLTDESLKMIVQHDWEFIELLVNQHKDTRELRRIAINKNWSCIESFDMDRIEEDEIWDMVRDQPGIITKLPVLTTDMIKHVLSLGGLYHLTNIANTNKLSDEILLWYAREYPERFAAQSACMKCRPLDVLVQVARAVGPSVALGAWDSCEPVREDNDDTTELIAELIRINPLYAYQFRNVYLARIGSPLRLVLIEALIARHSQDPDFLYSWHHMSCGKYLMEDRRRVQNELYCIPESRTRMIEVWPAVVLVRIVASYCTPDDFRSAARRDKSILTRLIESEFVKSVKPLLHELLRAAVEDDPTYIDRVSSASEELQMQAVTLDPRTIEFISNPCMAAAIVATQLDPDCVALIRHTDVEFVKSVSNINARMRGHKRVATTAIDEADGAKKVKSEESGTLATA